MISMIHNSLSPPDKRHYLRRPVIAYVELGEDNGGIIVDASEAGFRVQAVFELEAGCSLRMRFRPDQTCGWGQAKGQIVWTSETKRVAGIEFCDPPHVGREVLRGLLREARALLREASSPQISDQGTDHAEPDATDRTGDAAAAHSEAQGADSTSIARFDTEAATFFESHAPDALKQTAQPVKILGTSDGAEGPSTRLTVVVIAILTCVLVSGLIGVFQPDMASRIFQTIHQFISHSHAARPAASVSVSPSSAPIPRESGSSVSSANFKASLPLPSPSARDLPGTVLQVAAMNKLENADALVGSLKGNDFPAFVSRRAADRFYKVFVGPYNDPHSVDAVKERLTLQGIEAIEIRWLP